MKVRVNRFMRGGICFVGFQSIEVTPEDNERFQKFGIPMIQILIGNGPRTTVAIPLNGLNPGQTAGFTDPGEARQYEERVLNEAKALYGALREKKDEFSGMREVDL